MEWSLKTTEDRPQKPPLVLRLTIPFLLFLLLAWGLSHWARLPEESLSLTENEVLHLINHHKTTPVYLQEPFFITGTVAQLGNGHVYLSHGTRIEFPSGKVPSRLAPGAVETLKVQVRDVGEPLVLEARMPLSL